MSVDRCIFCNSDREIIAETGLSVAFFDGRAMEPPESDAAVGMEKEKSRSELNSARPRMTSTIFTSQAHARTTRLTKPKGDTKNRRSLLPYVGRASWLWRSL